MKKLAMVFAVSLLGSFAMAAELTAADLANGVIIKAVEVEPTSNMNGEMSCHIGYKMVPKYCVTSKGWERCGCACEFDSTSGGL